MSDSITRLYEGMVAAETLLRESNRHKGGTMVGVLPSTGAELIQLRNQFRESITSELNGQSFPGGIIIEAVGLKRENDMYWVELIQEDQASRLCRVIEESRATRSVREKWRTSFCADLSSYYCVRLEHLGFWELEACDDRIFSDASFDVGSATIWAKSAGKPCHCAAVFFSRASPSPILQLRKIVRHLCLTPKLVLRAEALYRHLWGW